MKPLTYRSYAKINLYLDILNRRADGFTNIETIFQTVSLWDELLFEPTDQDIQLTCNSPALAEPTGNLVYRAALLLKEATGSTHGAAIHLEKRIPIAAGLAGGSGNAAATLVALNQLWSLGLSDAHLEELAATLGSDVPYCLRGGTVAATGRGEHMESLPPIDTRWLVLVHPPLAITAGHAYGHPQLTRNMETTIGGKTGAFRSALDKLRNGSIPELIFNRMESGVLNDHPELAAIESRLIALKCSACAMSGSGPTVFGLCTDENHATHVASEISDYPASVVHTVSQGVMRCS